MDDRAYEIPTVDRLIAVLNNGDDGADATKDYREIMEVLPNRVQQHGGTHKAKLVLTIEFSADKNGMDVALTSESKLPKRPKLKERYFVSERGTLTAKDPGKDTMFPGVDMGRRQRAAAGE